MTFWSGERLSEDGRNIFAPFFEDQIDCNAYVLRMGNRYYRTADRERSDAQKITTLASNESLVIPAGQFAFLLSHEQVRIPANAMAFISMRTPTKFQGLINVSGFNVDPGYSGHLVYAVYNASPSPILLTQGQRLFKIWLCDLDRVSAPPYIKHENAGHNDITSEMVRGMNREILSLQSLADKLREQDTLIEKKFAEQKPTIDNLTFVWRAVIVGVVIALVVSLLIFGWDKIDRWISPATNQQIQQTPPQSPGS